MEVNRQLFGYKLAKRYLISLYYMLALLKPCWEFVLRVFLWSAQKLLNAMPYIETLNIFECTGCVVKPFSIILWWWGSRICSCADGIFAFQEVAFMTQTFVSPGWNWSCADLSGKVWATCIHNEQTHHSLLKANQLFPWNLHHPAPSAMVRHRLPWAHLGFTSTTFDV